MYVGKFVLQRGVGSLLAETTFIIPERVSDIIRLAAAYNWPFDEHDDGDLDEIINPGNHLRKAIFFPQYYIHVSGLVGMLFMAKIRWYVRRRKCMYIPAQRSNSNCV